MSNCTIYQNVTLGAKNDKYPSIRNNVTIYPGTVIVGNIEIGENAVIGALSFVDKSVEKSDIFHSRS
jgi:serine O-acetyltransferase